MGKSLNQLVREYLEQVARRNDAEKDIERLRVLTAEGKGRSRGWRFSRDEMLARTKLSR